MRIPESSTVGNRIKWYSCFWKHCPQNWSVFLNSMHHGAKVFLYLYSSSNLISLKVPDLFLAGSSKIWIIFISYINQSVAFPEGIWDPPSALLVCIHPLGLSSATPVAPTVGASARFAPVSFHFNRMREAEGSATRDRRDYWPRLDINIYCKNQINSVNIKCKDYLQLAFTV